MAHIMSFCDDPVWLAKNLKRFEFLSQQQEQVQFCICNTISLETVMNSQPLTQTKLQILTDTALCVVIKSSYHLNYWHMYEYAPK